MEKFNIGGERYEIYDRMIVRDKKVTQRENELNSLRKGQRKSYQKERERDRKIEKEVEKFKERKKK